MVLLSRIRLHGAGVDMRHTRRAGRGTDAHIQLADVHDRLQPRVEDPGKGRLRHEGGQEEEVRIPPGHAPVLEVCGWALVDGRYGLLITAGDEQRNGESQDGGGLHTRDSLCVGLMWRSRTSCARTMPTIT